MATLLTLLLTLLLLGAFTVPTVRANDEYTTVLLTLSGPDAAMAFRPAHLELRVGTRYRLRIVNAGPVDHESDAPNLVLSVESEAVEVFDGSGKRLARVVGRPDEIILAPGARVDWYLMPIKAITGDILCDIPGHLAAGMRGTFRIAP
jgi:uncharacterized cupredoxin-like copper-binding protein